MHEVTGSLAAQASRHHSGRLAGGVRGLVRAPRLGLARHGASGCEVEGALEAPPNRIAKPLRPRFLRLTFEGQTCRPSTLVDRDVVARPRSQLRRQNVASAARRGSGTRPRGASRAPSSSHPLAPCRARPSRGAQPHHQTPPAQRPETSRYACAASEPVTACTAMRAAASEPDRQGLRNRGCATRAGQFFGNVELLGAAGVRSRRLGFGRWWVEF